MKLQEIDWWFSQYYSGSISCTGWLYQKIIFIIEKLVKTKKTGGLKLYKYRLMDNHLHLLTGEQYMH
ncbi:hypothetical protein [Anaerosolibacter sp.]|uniref:hypothetical protein n=1 Tax=Anaerosolibacter sp. TaxID=1872527 RepID=UPI0039EEECD8